MGPNCQHLLPPLDSAEEREENEIGQFGPLKGWFFSPIERRDKGDEDEPIKRANRELMKENLISVP